MNFQRRDAKTQKIKMISAVVIKNSVCQCKNWCGTI